VAEWKGKRYYFHMVDEVEPGEEDEESSWYRRYGLYELTEEEWAEEDERHDSVVRHVGTHYDYRSDGTRNHGGVQPRESWAGHYERYPHPRSWIGAPTEVTRPAIHTFER
jgi:hypothetical protein